MNPWKSKDNLKIAINNMMQHMSFEELWELACAARSILK